MVESDLVIAGQSIVPGESKDIALQVSESYLGVPTYIPVHVVRAKEPGPTVFVTGAVHGDEINGTGIVRELMFKTLEIMKGTVIFVPVVNVFGFEAHARYLPDRQDLNRCFPGSATGSMSYRVAHVFFQEIVSKCDVGIDLHTAAVRKTNYPHIRADLDVAGMEELAFAFGCEVVVNKKGDEGSLRENATQAGCPTLLYEGGEALKFEQSIIDLGVRGVRNILIKLGMLPGKRVKPSYQTRVDKTVWVRSDDGGLLRFHVSPGEIVTKGQSLATNEQLLSPEEAIIVSPIDGIVLNMTTLPAVKPGEAICHIASPQKALEEIQQEIESSPKTLHRRLEDDLATSFHVSEPEEPTES